MTDLDIRERFPIGSRVLAGISGERNRPARVVGYGVKWTNTVRIIFDGAKSPQNYHVDFIKSQRQEIRHE